MNEYLVFLETYVINDEGGEGREEQSFLCKADDRRHAEEQAMNAYPTYDILRVCRVVDLDECRG